MTIAALRDRRQPRACSTCAASTAYLLEPSAGACCSAGATALARRGDPGQAGFDFDIRHPRRCRRLRLRRGVGADRLAAKASAARRAPPAVPGAAAATWAGRPSVNNVETFCAAAAHPATAAPGGPAIGTRQVAPAPRSIRVSGDCKRPGVYESLRHPHRPILEDCGATDTLAVQVGGPSGELLVAASSAASICFDDLATGGALMVFDRSRDMLEMRAASRTSSPTRAAASARPAASATCCSRSAWTSSPPAWRAARHRRAVEPRQDGARPRAAAASARPPQPAARHHAKFRPAYEAPPEGTLLRAGVQRSMPSCRLGARLSGRD